MKAPFVSNEGGDPRMFCQVFAKNSLIKNIYLVYFDQGEDFKLTTEMSEKVRYSHNQTIKNGENEAILLI